MPKQTHERLIAEARESGAALTDQGAFEIDTTAGSVEWVNEFALGVMGCSSEQVSSMSVFDMSPERFHDRIREDLASDAPAKTRRYIFPTLTSDGRVAWWYAFRTRTTDSRRMVFADHIQDTPRSGPEFLFMAIQVDTLNSQADLEERMGELEEWVKEQIARVDGDLGGIHGTLSSLQGSLEKAEQAALSAAADSTAAKNAALATQRELQKYATKEDLQRHFEKFDVFEEENTKATTEILRLIKTDNVHESRMKAYEDHVKRTTESAVKAIELQASRAGKGLSRKVTVPIFVVTTLAMVFQFILQHWKIHILP